MWYAYWTYWKHLMDVAKRKSKSSWPGTSTSYAHLIWCWLIRAWHKYLVGGWPTPLKNVSEFVSWDDEIPKIWKNKMHVPNHQPDIDGTCHGNCYRIYRPTLRWMCTVSITVSNADQTVGWCLSHSRKKCGWSCWNHFGSSKPMPMSFMKQVLTQVLTPT